ncbi:MAG: DUF1080 domain-containing protein [Pirellulales bacterium]|nr:DUF1080 domain-containing protein [Pirellulales bacterium]
MSAPPRPKRAKQDARLNALTSAERQEGFSLLFNGKNLDGWHGDVKHYRVKDGVLICEGKKIFTDKEYDDFVLRFDFRLPPAGNNGIGIRTPDRGNPAYDGMEIQILDDPHPNHQGLQPYQLHGSIYGVAPPKRYALQLVGQWNEEEIIADGGRIRVTVNGTVVLDVDLRSLPEETPDRQKHPGLHNSKGHLSLLGHRSPVEFRNLRVKEIEKEKTGRRFLQAGPPAPTATPRVRMVDVNRGETAEVELCDGTKVQLRLFEIQETRDSLRGAVRKARVQVAVDGEKIWLDSANYHLPVTVGKVQIDCPVTKGLVSQSRRDAWGLTKDARLRIWPAASPLFGPGKFVYPIKQRWFASATQMANEPAYVNGCDDLRERNIYYHYGLDFGAAEGLTEIVAATDGIVISSGKSVLPGYKHTPVAPRGDVVYTRDDQGWYYRYSHLQTIDKEIQPGAKVTAGQRVGLVGKEGSSGGWSHLHFDIFCRQPSGRWGCQESYAFVWEAYRNRYHPQIAAHARPHHLVVTGEKAALNGSGSWSADSPIERYRWTFTDGGHAEGARIERQYDRPGYYSEVLQVTDAAGRSDYDFAVVVVAERGHPERIPPAIHVAYDPTLDVRVGDEVTFKARTFGDTQGEETWDFGDGSSRATTASNRDADQHAQDGYAVIKHRYERPGDYLVRVERKNRRGWPAVGYVHVPVLPKKE